MASRAPGLDFDARRVARVERAVGAAEVVAEALLAACAAPFVAEAFANTRPNPGEASDATAELRSRIDTLVGALQSAHDALPGGRVAEARVTRQRGEDAGFASLPQAVALRIFAALPADKRARCSLVCREWRVMLLQSGAWLHLDLSKRSGVTRPFTDAFLLAASARARGQLQSLKLDGNDFTKETVQQVVEANGVTLRELSWPGFGLLVTNVDAWLSAAPSLRIVRVEIQASLEDAVRLLRNGAPLGPLHVCGLHLLGDASQPRPADEPLFPELLAAVRAHAFVSQLSLENFPVNAEAVDALVDVVLACKMTYFQLDNCGVPPASVGALARLLKSSHVLQFLDITNHEDDAPLLGAVADGVELAAALAANTTLQSLSLDDVDFWDNHEAAAAVLRAATGHPSLCEIDLLNNDVGDAPWAGAQLAAVIAANSRALKELYIGGGESEFRDVGMAPLMDALPLNTHLRTLSCGDVGMSEQFVRDRFLPAVRANTSLRVLDAGGSDMNVADPARAALLEAEALVKARAAAYASGR